MPQNSDSIPLRLAAVYESRGRCNIPSCAFSTCGKYFAFVESPCMAAIYPVSPLTRACLTDVPASVNAPPQATHHNSDTLESCSPWRILTSELLSGHSSPMDLHPVCRIQANGVIQCIAFALGNISHCRLPHRTRKRMSPVIQGTSVSLVLLGLITGYTEIYNLYDISVAMTRVPNMVLFADNLPIYVLTVATDMSLRVASVQLNGDVKLWDLWDDGNMYASLMRNFVFPSTNTPNADMICGEACTFAWQPHGSHICLAGEKGNAVVLQSEKPFTRVSTLRPGHCNRILAACYTHDGSLLLTASHDSSTIVWSVPEYSPLYHYWHMGKIPSLLLRGGANGRHVYGLTIAPDNLTFVTICEDRCVRLWPMFPATSPIKTYFELALPITAGPKLRSVVFSPCGRLILVTASDSRLLVFTTPSRSLNLTTLCLRVIRRCITCHLQGKYLGQWPDYVVKPTIPRLLEMPTTAFARAVSDLPLPPQLLVSILREFHTPVESCQMFN